VREEKQKMMSLILVVCLSASPTVCREEQPPLGAVNGASCMIQGQLLATQWLDEHPKWALKGWRCRFGAREDAT
jgi:hypothetical protein